MLFIFWMDTILKGFSEFLEMLKKSQRWKCKSKLEITLSVQKIHIFLHLFSNSGWGTSKNPSFLSISSTTHNSKTHTHKKSHFVTLPYQEWYSVLWFTVLFFRKFITSFSHYFVIVLIYSDKCIAAAKEEDVNKALAILNELPDINKRVLHYLIKFLQVMLNPEYQQKTKMSINNIAMIFGPCILRCPSDQPSVIFESTKFEQVFVRLLILGVK